MLLKGNLNDPPSTASFTSGGNFNQNKPQDLAATGGANYTANFLNFNSTTQVTINASREVNVTHTGDPGVLPGSNKSLGKFLNMTRSNGSGFISLFFHYAGTEVVAAGILNAENLRLWHFNNTTGWEVFVESSVNVLSNYVYANLTNFSVVAVGGATVCNWVTSAFSACTNGVQTRTVTETNFCGSTAGQPAASQACSVIIAAGGGGGGAAGAADAPKAAVRPAGQIPISVLPIAAFESAKPVDLALGVPAVVEFKSLPEVAAIKLEAKAAVSGAIVEAFRLSGRPSQISVDPPGRAFAFLAIEAKGVEAKDLKGAEVEFRVKRAWFLENDIDEDTVKLNRFNEEWESYTAKWMGSEGDDVLYSASVPGFSVFAITGETKKETLAAIAAPTQTPAPTPAPVAPPLPTPTQRSPGFEALMAALSIAAALHLRRRGR